MLGLSRKKEGGERRFVGPPSYPLNKGHARAHLSQILVSTISLLEFNSNSIQTVKHFFHVYLVIATTTSNYDDYVPHFMY